MRILAMQHNQLETYLQRTAWGMVRRHLSAVSSEEGFSISYDQTLNLTVHGNSAAAAAASEVASSDWILLIIGWGLPLSRRVTAVGPFPDSGTEKFKFEK